MRLQFWELICCCCVFQFAFLMSFGYEGLDFGFPTFALAIDLANALSDFGYDLTEYFGGF